MFHHPRITIIGSRASAIRVGVGIVIISEQHLRA